MSSRIHQSIKEPIGREMEYKDRWEHPVRTLIFSWDNGRKMVAKQPDLAKRAKTGELVELPWRRGSWHYLAMWQGLRGEDLNIDPETPLAIPNPNPSKQAPAKVYHFPFDGYPAEYAKRLENEGLLFRWFDRYR